MVSRRNHAAWARGAVAEYNLDPTAGHILLVLATYANHEGWAWPGRSTLMTDTGYSRPTIDRGLSAGFGPPVPSSTSPRPPAGPHGTG